MPNKKFQTILLIIFGVASVFAVMVFAGYIPTPSSKQKVKGSGTVVVWGVVNDPQFLSYMNDLSNGINDFKISYIPKNKDTYQSELIESFADGNAPDLFFIDNFALPFFFIFFSRVIIKMFSSSQILKFCLNIVNGFLL